MADPWRTEFSRAKCLTCGWMPEGDTPHREGAHAVQHKRELPDHEVVIDREQTRRVEVKRKG